MDDEKKQGDRPFERKGPSRGSFRKDGDRPARRFDGDRPRRTFGDKPRFGGDRPQRSFDGDRPPRKDFGDRPPRRDFGDRPRSFDGDRPPRREFGDRPPRRDFGDRPPRREFGDRPPRREFGDRPQRSFGDRPRSFDGDRPPRREFGDRPPRRDFGDRPRPFDGDRPPRREFGDRPPRRDFGDRPPRRDFGDRPRSFDGDRPPRREFGDRPPRRDFGDRPPRRDFGGGRGFGGRGYRQQESGERNPSFDEFEPLHIEGQEIAEDADTFILGKNAVLEAIRAGTSVNKVVVRKTLRADHTVLEIFEECKNRGIRVDQASDHEMKRINARDIAAQACPVEYKEVEDVIESITDLEQCLIIVCDGIEDPYNLGAIIRSAECFGAKAVIIPKHGAAPVNATVMKASSGAASSMDICRVPNIKLAMGKFKDAGFWIYGSDIQAEKTIHDVNFDAKTVLVVGSEGDGMHETVKSSCDDMVKIPMHGQINSLNASVASAVLMWEYVRKNVK